MATLFTHHNTLSGCTESSCSTKLFSEGSCVIRTRKCNEYVQGVQQHIVVTPYIAVRLGMLRSLPCIQAQQAIMTHQTFWLACLVLHVVCDKAQLLVLTHN